MAVISIGIAQGDFNLTIFHVNDIHVRFEETDTYSGTCKKDEIPGQGELDCLKSFSNKFRNKQFQIFHF